MTGVGGRLLACAILGGLLISGVVPWLDVDAHASNHSLTPARVAITIDDLPETGVATPGVSRADIVKLIIKALKANGVEAYGFANGRFVKDRPEETAILKEWMAADFPLGNHTRDHIDLRASEVAPYIDNIEAEAELLRGLNASSRSATAGRLLFRYPYQEEGETLEKRDAVRAYLTAKGYRIAPVTFDYSDWVWNSAYERCLSQQDENRSRWLEAHAVESADHMLHGAQTLAKSLYNRDIPHILLIHCNLFTARILDRLLKHWHLHDVQFVSLATAMEDPVYSVNPNIAYSNGLRFLEQIARARHFEVARLRDPLYPVNRIDRVCVDPSVD